MKRLYRLMMSEEERTSTYHKMYNGAMGIDPGVGMPYEDHCPIYYHGEIGFEITATHKLAMDKPTITVMIPAGMLGIDSYTAAAADHCLRRMAKYIDSLNAELYNRSRPDRENGKYYLYRPGGEILTRNTGYFALCPQRDYDYGHGLRVILYNDGVERPPQMCLCIKMQVQLPARKLKKAAHMLCRDLPEAVELFVQEFDPTAFESAMELAAKQAAIRAWLRDSEYCAFIANGSILPRHKGTDLPMAKAVPFRSPAADEIEVCGIRGIGIKRGVTVITGGGYSGKSTLLDAISAGIYDHTGGDGRELCITDDSAMTVSAEDGRSVKEVNISPFIKWLPGGDTRHFSTDRASGSTSQAANIMEAVDASSRLLLIDEDRSATNFMIRDGMMKELIEKEPITPFTDRVGELFRGLGVSSILVIGGSGEYLSVADRIYMMEDYLIHDVTEKSREICRRHGVTADVPPAAPWLQKRTLLSDGFTSYPSGSGSERLEVSEMGFIFIGDEAIDVRGLHDIITDAQLDCLGFMLRYLEVSNRDSVIDVSEKLDALYGRIGDEGLDFIYSGFFTTCNRFMDLPRKCDLTAVINRMRRVIFSGSL